MFKTKRILNKWHIDLSMSKSYTLLFDQGRDIKFRQRKSVGLIPLDHETRYRC